MNTRRETRRAVRFAGTLTVGLAVFLNSCGTILYPERRGQPAGRLDPAIVVLDGIGLLLFFVPGVVAFVVDFATGAIYLPSEYSRADPGREMDLRVVHVRVVHVDRADLTPHRLEEIVHEQTGKVVNLQPGAYRARRLQHLDQLTPKALAGLEADAPARVIFRASAK
jgi:hypothetical protein